MDDLDKLVEQCNTVCDLYFKTGNSQKFVIAIARLQDLLVEIENSEDNKHPDNSILKYLRDAKK